MGSGQHTIRTVLKLTQDWFAGKEIPSARLDAEILLAHVLDLDRLGLYLDMDRPLTAAELGAYRALVRRRGGREPVAYILGRKEFYGLDFLVSPEVLIPRPDTELLVELALKQLPTDRHVRVADVCTGSGCVAVAIAANREKAEVWATEIDEGARQVASKNIAAHELGERIHLAKGDLFEPCLEHGPFDVVVGNPPYVLENALSGLSSDVRDYEPVLALVGPGTDGLGCHRRILAQVGSQIKEDGSVLLEIGYDQKSAAQAIDAAGWVFKTVHHDLAGHPRVAEWVRAKKVEG